MRARSNSSTIARQLLNWFQHAARPLPWRSTTDPYAIWVSEIMLQQTQVKTVIPYWERWMQALPTLDDLAKVDSHTLHKLWEGLGYYSRARNLQRAAQLIQERHQGRFPQAHAEVLALPGIGPYTAGAICSIAFNQATPILDGNVARVLSRVFTVAGDPSQRAVRERLWQLAAELVTAAGGLELKQNGRRSVRVHSDLNQALMELGALVCIPKAPRCDSCPIRRDCAAHRTSRMAEFPQLRARPPVTRRRFVAFVVRRGSCYLVRQRPDGVVNAQLWEFPNVETNQTDPLRAAVQAGVRPGGLTALATITHSITRYRITLEVYQGTTRAAAPRGSAWRTLAELHQLAFSSAHKRIIEKIGVSG